MKKIFLLFSLGLFLSSGFAQQILEVEADLIGVDYPNQLSFYKKNSEGSFDKTILHPHFKEIIHFTQIAEHDEVIEITSLQKQNPIKINAQLKNGLYLNQTINAHNLSLGNNGFIKIISYKKTNENSEWHHNFHSYFNYSLVQINQKYTIVYLLSSRFDRYFGFLVPKKENSIFSFSTNGDFPLEKNHEFQKVNRRLFPVDVLDTLPPPLNLKFTITKNHQLADYFSQEIVLVKKFDTLYMKNGFIIGRQNYKTLIYNQRLENITPKNLRVMQFMENTGRYDFSYPEVLVNNSVFWLTQDGKLIEEYPEGANCDYTSGWSANHDFVGIWEKNGQLLLHNAVLSENGFYEDAWFLNKKKEIDAQRLHGMNLYENYLIVRKDGRYGLLKYILDQKKEELQLETVLSIIYEFIFPMIFNADQKVMILENDGKFGLLSLKTENGSMEHLKIVDSLTLPIIFDDIQYLGKCQPFLLKTNNLYGYSGIQETPKYDDLQPFKRNFARYTMSGKKGWLDRNGNEYPDIK